MREPSAPLRRAVRLALFVAFAGASLASARQGEPPYSLEHPERTTSAIPIDVVGSIDAARRRAETDDDARSR